MIFILEFNSETVLLIGCFSLHTVGVFDVLACLGLAPSVVIG